MIVEASITGLFKTALIILGALVLLRFVGRLMIAKRNMEAERRASESSRLFDRERQEKLRNFGKTRIVADGKDSRNSKRVNENVEDVDFEELH